MRVLSRIFCLSTCAAALLWGVTAQRALAACDTDNAQCEVSDGSIEIPSGMTFVPAGTGENKAAFVVTHGSEVYGSNLTITTPLTNNFYAGFVGVGSYVDLIDSTVTGWYGLRSEGMLFVENTMIETHGAQAYGVQADEGDTVLWDVTINVHGTGTGLVANNNGTYIQMHGGGIDAAGENAVGVISHGGSFIDLNGVTIDSSNNTTGGGGVRAQSGAQIWLDYSTVTTQGAFAPALAFVGTTTTINDITLDSATVTAQDAVAVLANGGVNTASFSNSTIAGDRLAFADNLMQGGQTHHSHLEIFAQNSQLSGHTMVSDGSRLEMYLQNDARWTLRPSAAGDRRSTISRLDLYKSDIVFDQAGSGLYQELVVKHNTPSYMMSNGGSITFNTYLNDGGDWSRQFTDRLLVNGNVYGETLVHIKEVPGSPGGLTSPTGANLNNEGISLIQVSGSASENLFILADGYVTMTSLPYEYRLYAYGPGSANGEADPLQRQVDGANHWDFRLQSACAGACPALQVVPQIANYLVAPTALFQAGLQDMGSLRERLGEMRMKHAGKREFFLRGHGGDYDWRSNLNAARYGYDADIRYTALQLGGNVYGVESKNTVLSVGFAGSYGDLAFTPHRTGSRKTKMALWSATPYLTWQHDSGAYLNVAVSHGRFNGLVTTQARGRTARLQGRSVTTSIEAGMPVAFGNNDWSVQPQLQLIHQKLKFNDTADVDNFAVKLGQPKQITARAGGVLTKYFSPDAKLYGTLNLIHSFADKNKAWFGDDFEIGRAGTSLETGVGAQITVGKNFTVYGETNWQRRLRHGGINGFTLNVGVDFRF